MLQTAVILAGGFGTRLQSVVHDVPKPMAPVNGQPFLNYQLRYLKHFGITRICLSVGYLHEKIRDYYGTSFEGLSICYSHETQPLGTGGGLRQAFEMLEDRELLALNGDSLFEVDLHGFLNAHQISGASVSLALRQVDDASRFGTIQSDSTGRISSFREKTGVHQKGIINGGVYIFNRQTLITHSTPTSNFSIEKNFFETHLQTLPIFGYLSQGYFIDIGLPSELEKAQHDFTRFTY